jgi:hypothetical protein
MGGLWTRSIRLGRAGAVGVTRQPIPVDPGRDAAGEVAYSTGGVGLRQESIRALGQCAKTN